MVWKKGIDYYEIRDEFGEIVEKVQSIHTAKTIKTNFKRKYGANLTIHKIGDEE